MQLSQEWRRIHWKFLGFAKVPALIKFINETFFKIEKNKMFQSVVVLLFNMHIFILISNNSK